MEVAKSLASYTTQFRNPSWVGRVQKTIDVFVLHSVLILSCDVCTHSTKHWPLDLLWPKASSDKASSARSRATLILQQFVYHNRERVGVGFSQVCMVVRCGDAQEAACCECFACDGGGPSWNLLSCRFWQGVRSVRNLRYTLLVRVDKAPRAMVGCGHTHWHWLLQYAQKRHATETLWGSRSGECGGAVISELKRQKVRPCGWCPVVPAMVSPGPRPVPTQFGFWNISAWSRDVFETLTGSCTESRWGLHFALACHSACHVMSFFSARPPCRQPQTALTIRMLLWSQEVQRPRNIGLWTSCDQRRLRTRQVQLAAAQPLFCSSLSITIEKGWALASVKCAWWWDAVMHKRPLVASVLRVMVEGLLGTFCPVDSGKESAVWETYAIYSLSELTRLPLQWSDVATLIDTDFCNMHKRVTQLKRCEAADQESVAVLLFQNWKDRKFDRAVGARWFLRWFLPCIWEFLEVGNPKMISNDQTLSTILLFDIIFHGETRTLDTNSFGMARIPEKIRIAAIGPAWLEQSQQKGRLKMPWQWLNCSPWMVKTGIKMDL